MATTIQQLSEPRQIHKVLPFPAQFAPYINWVAIATQARELGAHFEARYEHDGACTVILFWSYSEDEV